VQQRGFETYRVPLAPDALPVAVALLEGAPSYAPMGVKGAGEILILAVAAAVSCAVANATGVAVDEIPLTPPRVLGMVRQGGGSVRLGHISTHWGANTIAGGD
jgi:CO/xanthine dehydrogenase Mo-binding subunit